MAGGARHAAGRATTHDRTRVLPTGTAGPTSQQLRRRHREESKTMAPAPRQALGCRPGHGLLPDSRARWSDPGQLQRSERRTAITRRSGKALVSCRASATNLDPSRPLRDFSQPAAKVPRVFALKARRHQRKDGPWPECSRSAISASLLHSVPEVVPHLEGGPKLRARLREFGQVECLTLAQ